MVPEVQLVEKKAWGEGQGSAPPTPTQLFPCSKKHFTPAISIKLWGKIMLGRFFFFFLKKHKFLKLIRHINSRCVHTWDIKKMSKDHHSMYEHIQPAVR